MSSILLYVSDNFAMVATDTLVTDKGGSPVSFTSKALYLPHLRTIVAATGLAGISSKWFLRINDYLAVEGFEDLHSITPKHLQSIFSDLPTPHQSVSTSVYQIGISEVDGAIHGYTYSSQYEFDPRPIPRNQFGGKPAMGDLPEMEPPELFTRLMEQQRTLQSNEPIDSRIHIGGEIQLIFLEASSNSARMLTTHKFEDYEEQLAFFMSRRT